MLSSGGEGTAPQRTAVKTEWCDVFDAKQTMCTFPTAIDRSIGTETFCFVLNSPARNRASVKINSTTAMRKLVEWICTRRHRRQFSKSRCTITRDRSSTLNGSHRLRTQTSHIEHLPRPVRPDAARPSFGYRPCFELRTIRDDVTWRLSPSSSISSHGWSSSGPTAAPVIKNTVYSDYFVLFKLYCATFSGCHHLS